MALGHWLKDYIGPRGSGGSGGDIPTPTIEDAGKVLAVSDAGQYELSANSGCDPGYSCTEEWVTLTDESVTTAEGEYGSVGTLAYSTPIDADTIKVTFNGTEYTCDKTLMGGSVSYGGVGEQGPDFSEYPFAIISIAESGNILYTETAGTYQVKIEAVVPTSVSITSCFKKAVTEASKPLVLNINNNTLDKTFAEIRDAYLSGRTVLLTSPGLNSENHYPITGMSVEPNGGGTLTFGAGTGQTNFSASADDAHPTLAV